jgi:3D (Asp-Asp-Asp) domain-containing protein
VLVLLAVPAADAAGPGRKAAALRGQTSILNARAHHALLDLYALDTRYRNAQSLLASLRSQAARLRGQQTLLSQQLSATRRTLTDSQQRLADNLRTLYERGDTDALAVVLGAQSLDDAMTGLDDLTRMTDQSRRIMQVTSDAQSRLVRLRSTLSAQRAELNAAVVSAQRTADDLASARAARLSFIGRLRSEQRLKTRQITALQAAAVQVEAKSQALQAAALANASTPAAPASSTTDTAAAAAPAPTPAPATTPALGGRTITVTSTGYSLTGRTATGIPVGWGVVAVDPALIPLGTRLTIPGYGDSVAADTGSAVRGATIDLWFPTLAQARAWGRRTVTITLH